MNTGYHFLGMGLIGWTILTLVIISLFVFLKPYKKKSRRSKPFDILQQKFSKGKITAPEYEQRKRFLEKEQDLKMRMFFLSSLSKD